MTKFSSVVSKVLEERGMTSYALAKQMGYTPQYIHDLLNGNRRWNENTMAKACEVLGLEIEFKQKQVV